MHQITGEYSKDVKLMKMGRKFRISKESSIQVRPKITRYRKKRLSEADIACNHFEGKRKGVVCNAGELTRNEILGKLTIFRFEVEWILSQTV